jgi:transcriptional regulator with XRE-family HTH domain
MVNVKRPDKSIKRQKEIGAKLRALREDKGWSLQGVARRLDPPVSHQRLAAWEVGEYMMTVDRIEELAGLYAVHPADVLGYDKWKPKRRGKT